MSIKTQVQAEMDRVFYDPDGFFTETVSWNGADVPVIREHDDDQDSVRESSPEDGVLIERRTYWFRLDDLDPRPVPWEQVALNGETWTVEQATPIGNRLRVRMFRYSS